MSTHFSRVDAGQFRDALNNALRTAMKRSQISILEEAVICFEENRCTITCTKLRSQPMERHFPSSFPRRGAF